MSTPAHESSLSTHKPELYNKNANFVYSDAATAPVLSMLSAQPGERILDFGCGSGELTHRLESLVGEKGEIWGVDANAEMIAKAVKAFPSLAERLFQGDLQSLDVPSRLQGSFDKVFTSATLHWCKRDPGGVLEAAKKCLKPGGRFVGEMGGFMNCISVRSHLHRILEEKGIDPVPLDPWFFPSEAMYEDLLKTHGFTPVSVTLHPRYTPLPTDLNGWLATFARGSFLSGFSEAEAKEIVDECVRRCTVDCRDDQGNWAIMYMRLRFEAVALL